VLPAKVVTTPAGVIFGIKFPLEGIENKFPLESIAKSAGLSRFPAEPLAFVNANVETEPAGVIFLIFSSLVSATNTLPAESTAIPLASLILASVPIPSWLPSEEKLPAKVVTTPAGVIFLIIDLPPII